MSEIQGFGPAQPIRPATPASRTSQARPAEQAEGGPGFGDDAVHVSAAPAAPEIRAEAAAALPEAPGAPRIASPDRPAVEEIDGFIVAGSGQSASGLSRGADAGRTTPTGPIALLEEPASREAEFPGLWLNGPSHAAEGLHDLSGRRIA